MKTIEYNIASSVAGFVGMTIMSTAAVVSMLELHHNPMPKMAAHAEVAPSHAPGNDNAHFRMEERVRREKEETRHAMASYGVMMRSHPTTGPA